MNRRSRTTRLALALAIAILVAGCGTESPTAPLEVAAHRSSGNHGPRFSDWSDPVNLGPVVNSDAVDIEVTVSRDGRTLYFASNRPGGLGGFDIYVTHRRSRQHPWGLPENLGATVNSSSNDQAPALSRDGRQLFFMSNRPGGYGGNDIYVSRRDRHDAVGWGEPSNVGAGVNSASNDQLPHPFVDENGSQQLYFNSNRRGGLGGTDIYLSGSLPDGTFGPAALVPELSCPLRDAGIAMRRDGLELILGSDRAGTLGNFDLWVATRARRSDPWSVPVNLGPGINTTDDEGRSAMSFDGRELYIISGRPGGSGNLDLWVATRRPRR